MKNYNKKSLFFVFLCAVFTLFAFTNVLCQERQEKQGIESIPLTSPLGKAFASLAASGKRYLDQNDIRNGFLSEDDRRINENDPLYVLLEMNMDTIRKSDGVVLSRDTYKGSGTILYRSSNYILILTAYHNLYDVSNTTIDKVTQMNVLEDNKDGKHPSSVLAEMVDIDNDYIQVGSKDIGLVAVKLKNGSSFSVVNDKAIYDILDFGSIQQAGQSNNIDVQLNQYPAYFDWYVRCNGTAYHNNSIGYHDIPTLPGSSGASIIVNNSTSSKNIVGVHVRSGTLAPRSIPNIVYNSKKVLVENNIFELISLDEVEQEGIKLSNNKNKAILTDLIQKYTNSINQQKKDKLIEYLKHGRKIKNDRDMDWEFLKAINRLNTEIMFWTNWYFWSAEIKEITDDVVKAYNYKINGKYDL